VVISSQIKYFINDLSTHFTTLRKLLKIVIDSFGEKNVRQEEIE